MTYYFDLRGRRPFRMQFLSRIVATTPLSGQPDRMQRLLNHRLPAARTAADWRMGSAAVKRDAADGISSVIARRIRSTFGAVGFADLVDHHTTGEVALRPRSPSRTRDSGATHSGARRRSSSPPVEDTNRHERDRQGRAFAPRKDPFAPRRPVIVAP